MIEERQQDEDGDAGGDQPGGSRQADRKAVADAERIDALVGVGEQGGARRTGRLVGPQHQRRGHALLEPKLRVEGQRGLHGGRFP